MIECKVIKPIFKIMPRYIVEKLNDFSDYKLFVPTKKERRDPNCESWLTENDLYYELIKFEKKKNIKLFSDDPLSNLPSLDDVIAYIAWYLNKPLVRDQRFRKYIIGVEV